MNAITQSLKMINRIGLNWIIIKFVVQIVNIFIRVERLSGPRCNDLIGIFVRFTDPTPAG